MATPDTVVPNSLNYTDIKPQAIENKIMLTRYQPTATVTGAKGGDMVKFLLSGNGFLDPYSTYFDFTISVPLAQDELKWVDRSAHSFISRIVIRSQGVEIERLENYDVMAALINDMVYSPEQCVQHYWEGFPTHSINPETLTELTGGVSYTRVNNTTRDPASTVPAPSLSVRDVLFRWLNQGASPATQTHIGEVCFHQLASQLNTHPGETSPYNAAMRLVATVTDEEARVNPELRQAIRYTWNPVDFVYLIDNTYYEELTQQLPLYSVDIATILDVSIDPWEIGVQRSVIYPVTFAYHEKGRRIPSHIPNKLAVNILDAQQFAAASQIGPVGAQRMRFMIPIYSGLLGLLMPEKKLLPLNILPLDIEIVFNRHALYSSHTDAAGGTRNYRIDEFFLYGNTLFFEQEIHRTLEASVADHGLFIYCNSFHHAPQQLLGDDNVPTSMYISMNLKSINSVHWVFLYNYFETKSCARKLHFVSHNLKKLQLLNGTQLIPQYAIEGAAGTSKEGQQLPYLVELYKAWNKMHDPQRDGALHAYNMCGDEYNGQFDPMIAYGNSLGAANWTLRGAPAQGLLWKSEGDTLASAYQILNKQSNIGRCQYGISLEGEELGSDRTMITGRKSQYPFQLQMWSEGKFSRRPSYMITFIRADFIVYIRPDLQIVTLGK